MNVGRARQGVVHRRLNDTDGMVVVASGSDRLQSHKLLETMLAHAQGRAREDRAKSEDCSTRELLIRSVTVTMCKAAGGTYRRGERSVSLHQLPERVTDGGAANLRNGDRVDRSEALLNARSLDAVADENIVSRGNVARGEDSEETLGGALGELIDKQRLEHRLNFVRVRTEERGNTAKLGGLTE